MESQHVAEICKALSDPNRVRIMAILGREGEVCACQLLKQLDITQPTLSYHMKALTACGLITSSKEGRWMRYAIRSEVAGRFTEALGKLLV